MSLLAATALCLLARVEAVAYAYDAATEFPFVCDAEGDGRPEIGFLSATRLRLTEIGVPGPVFETNLPPGAWAVDPGAAPANGEALASVSAGIYVLLPERLVWLPLGGDPARDTREVLELANPLPPAPGAPVPFALVQRDAGARSYHVPAPDGIRVYDAEGTPRPDAGVSPELRGGTVFRAPVAQASSRPAQFIASATARFPEAAAPSAETLLPPRRGTPGQWTAAGALPPERWPWFYVSEAPEAPLRAFFHTEPEPEPRTVLRVELQETGATRTLGPERQYPGFPVAPRDGGTIDIDSDGFGDLLLWRGRRAMLPGSGALQHWRSGTWPVFLELYRFDPTFGRYEGQPYWRVQLDAPLRWMLQADVSGPVRHLFARDLNGDGRVSLGYAEGARTFVVWSAGPEDAGLDQRDAIETSSRIVGVETVVTLSNGRSVVLLLTEREALVIRSTIAEL